MIVLCAPERGGNSLRFAAALLGVALCAFPWPTPGAPAAGTGASGGTVTGTVEIGPELSSKRMRLELYASPVNAVKPGAAPADSGEMDNVVVYLEGVPFSGPDTARRPRPLVIAQHGESFVPHVLPVLKGDAVEFPNRDAVFHNVFSLSSSRSFDLGRYPRPQTKSVKFDRTGVVKVFCHIHSDMSSVVYVLDNPYFTVPERDGTFRLSGVPPGEYRLVAWHEHAKHPATRTVRIVAGATAEARLRLPFPDVRTN
jgi:plastocyanin